MKLRRHYKGKVYKVLGTAKNSESLEDFTIYEARYPNPLGQIWIRPTEMFNGEVEVDGSSQTRFAPVELKVESLVDASLPQLQRASPLVKELFPDLGPNWFAPEDSRDRRYILHVAQVEGELVGFKLGYDKPDGCHYSWLGGVKQDFRGLGIAAKLLSAQLESCRQLGHLKLQTKTLNQFLPMLILNLKAGFRITGTEDSKRGLKICLELRLE